MNPHLTDPSSEALENSALSFGKHNKIVCMRSDGNSCTRVNGNREGRGGWREEAGPIQTEGVSVVLPLPLFTIVTIQWMSSGENGAKEGKMTDG